MTLRSCSQCGNPAALSLCHLLSTVAVTPRKQKCGTSTLYCSACIQRMVEVLEASRHSALQELSKSVSEAYTALATPPEHDSDGERGRKS
jgi:hypothetical protein